MVSEDGREGGRKGRKEGEKKAGYVRGQGGRYAGR